MRWLLAGVLAACGGSSSVAHDAAPIGDATVDAVGPVSNRERLIRSYLGYLQSTPDRQSNGLLGSELATTCDLWTKLDPSARAVFLTLTARLEGSVIALDGTTMLDHVTKLYRAVGGDGASATSPGSCGGGEANRLIMAMDPMLHGVLRTVHDDTGGTAGARDVRDIPTTSFWRDSHDAGGAHAPFDESDETEGGAPRGQVQYFKDPAGTLATSPLGRTDLATLVEPYALEIDHDFDCVHASNPLCTYTYYGPLCAAEATQPGTDVYMATYGDFDPAWKPSGC